MDHSDKPMQKKTFMVTLDMLDESVKAHIRDLVHTEITKIREEERRSRRWTPFTSQHLPGPKETK